MDLVIGIFELTLAVGAYMILALVFFGMALEAIDTLRR